MFMYLIISCESHIQVMAHVCLLLIFTAQNKHTKYQILFHFKPWQPVLISVNDATTTIHSSSLVKSNFSCNIFPPVLMNVSLFFVYLGFYVAFNTVQVISRRVVGMAEETSR